MNIRKNRGFILEVVQAREQVVVDQFAEEVLVVWSVAMPDGASRPTMPPCGDDVLCKLGEGGVGVDVALARQRIAVAVADVIQRVLGGGLCCRVSLVQFGIVLLISAMSFRHRVAASTAAAMSGARMSKNSRS